MTYCENAAKLFFEGYNCAQATAAVFAERFGLTKEEMLALAAGFGAGMGGLREQCGAVSAMVLIAGLAKGTYSLKDADAKKRLYDTVKKMTADFKNEFGSSCCRELLEKASCKPLPDPSDRNKEYYKNRPCVRFVEGAVRIIETSI